MLSDDLGKTATCSRCGKRRIQKYKLLFVGETVLSGLNGYAKIALIERIWFSTVIAVALSAFPVICFIFL